MSRRKKQPRSVQWLILFILIVCLAYEPISSFLSERHACQQDEETECTATDTLQQEIPISKMPPAGSGMELPAPLKNREEHILKRMGYTVSYNKDWKLPNWVAWELNREKLIERESRSDRFLPDPDLPAEEAVTTEDYKGCGMDRGHMCPAGDNRWHWKTMQESFYMTNICPQHHNLNRGDWKELEEACRRWAQEEGSIYIVCGPILYNQQHRVIGKQQQVIVPEAFFKVVLCTAGDSPRAIGFIYKNTAGNKSLDSYVNTVDQVERITGIDFFPSLPDDIERQVEAHYDLSSWKIAAN